MTAIKPLKTHYQYTLPSGKVIALPRQLKEQLDIYIYDMLESEMDIVIVLDGKEGVGKSRSGRVIASYISHVINREGHKTKHFDVPNIHFETGEYISSAEAGKKFQVNVLDEGRNALNKRRGMAKGNILFLNWLSENRDKQQVHIIILPAVHDLESYIVDWRMTLLIHHLKIHKKDKSSKSGYRLVRGYFKVFKSVQDIQKVIKNRHKFGNYSYPRDYKYRRKFKDTEPFTDKQLIAYKNKKASSRKVKYDKAKEEVDVTKRPEVVIAQNMRDKGLSLSKIGELVGVSKATAAKWTNGKGVIDGNENVPRISSSVS